MPCCSTLFSNLCCVNLLQPVPVLIVPRWSIGASNDDDHKKNAIRYHAGLVVLPPSLH